MDTRERDEAFDKFMDEFQVLLKKYSVSIGGCGCCGSAWIEVEGESYVDGLTYFDGDSERTWETKTQQ